MDKNRITDSEIKFKLIELFESGITVYTECIESLRTNFTFSNERFAEIYTQSIKDWSELKAIAQREQVSINAVESLTIGLKPKLDRQLALQSQIESIERKLEIGKALQNTFQDGELILSERYLTPKEIIDYYRLVKDLHSELSKMDGSYAPTKIETKNPVCDDLVIVRHPAHYKTRPKPEIA